MSGDILILPFFFFYEVTEVKGRGNREIDPDGPVKIACTGSRSAMDRALTEKRKAFLSVDFSRGFIAHCRFKARTIRRGYFESTVDIRPYHRQQDGFIHAGVMAAMADHTAGYAAYTLVPEAFRILTIEFKINFLDPASGDRLICRSRIIREGTRIIVAESEVFDRREGKEHPAARALVTLTAVHADRLSSKG